MKLGVALPAAVRGTDNEILDALDAWVADVGVTPAYFLVWRSLTAPTVLGAPSARLVDALVERGTQPVVTLDSFHIPPADYLGLLTGGLDDVLRTFDDERLIVRFDPEMIGGRFPWANLPPGVYRAGFRHVRDVVRSQLFWCPQGHVKVLPRYADYFPGDAACDYVGFDRYDRDLPLTALPQAWSKPYEALRELTSKPILVGEFGAKQGLDGRAKWLRSAGRVIGIEGAIYFNLDLAAGASADWTLDAGMKRAFAEVMAA